jgi:high-affinity K+ transport system ATPase subunit B
VRPGDFIPADIMFLRGAQTVDQSALTGRSRDANKALGDVFSSGSDVRLLGGRQRHRHADLVLLTGKTFFGHTTELVQQTRSKLHIEAIAANLCALAFRVSADWRVWW